jgi:molecular chaperone IbpA
MAFTTLGRTTSPFRSFDRPDRTRRPLPAYDLVRSGDDRYRLALAVPGFSDEELEIETRKDELVVRGKAPSTGADEAVLHRGIERHPFERRFALAEHVRVDAARLERGLLQIDLVREVPEALRPRTIAIDKAA